MEINSSSTIHKVNKGGMGLHTPIFCYFHVDLNEGDKFIEHYNLKFSKSDTVLHEFTHFKWHGFHRASESYILHLEFLSGSMAIAIFSKRPVKMFTTKFMIFNMILTDEECQDRMSITMLHSNYGHVGRNVEVTTTMIYQGLDLVECHIPAKETVPNILVYNSIESADLLDIINRSYQPEKIADFVEMEDIINALIFCFRLDLGHRDEGHVVKYFPFTTAFGDLQFIMTNYNLHNEFNIARLASTFGKYCKKTPYEESKAYKEFIIYAPEPHYLIAILQSRVSWV